MKSHFIKSFPAASLIGFVLAWPGLANAEDYYRQTSLPTG